MPRCTTSSHSRMLRCTSWLLVLVISLVHPLQLLGHDLQANGVSETPLNAGDQARGQRKLLQLVIGGDNITATSTSTADVCVTQVLSAEGSDNATKVVQEAIVESAASNGGTVSAFFTANVTLSANLTAEALVSAVARVHAVASTSLEGCKILCVPKKAAKYLQRIIAPKLRSCLNRTMHICPMVGSKGYIVGNAYAIAKASAGGLGVAGVDANGNALAEASSNVTAYVYSPKGFAYASSGSYTDVTVLADGYLVGSGLYACASANATATVKNTVGLENCLIDCKKSSRRRLTSKDRAKSSYKIPSQCFVREVTQCFS